MTGVQTCAFRSKESDATKLMSVMSLGVKQGNEITIEVTGDDEAEAAAKIEEFFKTNL